MGLPIFGTSNYSNPNWVPEPNGRGTWGLVQTCLLTLGLCVYSAIHLNVFHRECAWWANLLIRCKWLLVALLAPEFIVFNAWSQRRQAMRIAHLLRKRYGQEEPRSLIFMAWDYVRSKAREVDLEGLKCLGKRQPRHRFLSKGWRTRQGECQSQSTQQSPSRLGSRSRSISKEQGGTQHHNSRKTTRISVKVRSTKPLLW